jgi:predicted PurR-regulated permease PerM
MNPRAESASHHRSNQALLWLLIAVSAAFGWILLPFYGTILWAGIIGLLFAPVHRRLLPLLGQRRTPAALVTLLLVLVIVIFPFALVTGALAREAAALFERLESGELNPALYLQSLFDALPEWITEQLDRIGLVDFGALQARLSAALAQGSQFIATQALSIGLNTFEFVAALMVTLYLAFFLIRDGAALTRAVNRAVPLAPAHKRELLDKFATVIRATVKGSLLVAAIQGALGGVAFWVLGVRGALLWGVVMAFLSLVPAVGAALLWLPVAIWFLMSGAVLKGVALIAYGVLVIGLIDNLLRPLLVGRDTGMPDYLVMITTLGGVAVFGINGFVLGPAIAAMFIAVWHIYGVSQGGESA